MTMSVRVIDGVQTTTHDEGDWQIQRVGQWSPWTATHTPTGTVIDTGATDLADAKQAVREQRPDLCVTAAPTGTYTVARGRQSAARPGRHAGEFR